MAVASAAATGCRPSGPTPPPTLAAGTPTDPDLTNPAVSWETVLTESEIRTATALCNLIIPADDVSPGAGEVGVPAFINEWVSAPYPAQRKDLVTIRGGLVWLDTEATERHGVVFADLDPDRQRTICNEVRYLPAAPARLKAAARFFRLFRNLTTSGFYTTPEGMADLGYVGNRALPNFPGPPPEVLRYLGLEND